MTGASSSIVLLACIASLTSLACKGAAPSAQQAPAPPAAPATPEAPAPPAANLPKHPVLDAYEQVRAALARDAIAEAIAAGKAIATAASEMQASASDALKPKLDAVGKAATAFAAASASDADATRKAFGEVSRAVVALVDAEPTLKQGRHVFECPMAQGYEKWVQVSDKINNPYMGSSMLTCGAQSTWGP